MANSTVQNDSDDGMDEFMDKFKNERYKNAFSEDKWEEVSQTSRYKQLSALSVTLFVPHRAVLTPVSLLLAGELI